MGFWSSFFKDSLGIDTSDKNTKQEEKIERPLTDIERLKKIIEEVNNLITIENYINQPIFEEFSDSDKELILEEIRSEFKGNEFFSTTREIRTYRVAYKKMEVVGYVVKLENSIPEISDEFDHYYTWAKNQLVSYCENKQSINIFSASSVFSREYMLEEIMFIFNNSNALLVDEHPSIFIDDSSVRSNDQYYFRISKSNDYYTSLNFKLKIIKLREEKKIRDKTNETVLEIENKLDGWLSSLVHERSNDISMSYTCDKAFLDIDSARQGIIALTRSELFCHIIEDEQTVEFSFNIFESPVDKDKGEHDLFSNDGAMLKIKMLQRQVEDLNKCLFS